ncbi:Glyoxalase/Bleomycin resistance protein/Dihydroxybiphenyl dioxygenase, partial [Bisporella sp. PMI_857]
LLSSQLISIAQSCAPQAPANNTGSNQFPQLIPGSNEPADPATTGFVLNHFALNVNNITRSIDFYTKVFGMRLIFNFRATEKLSIAYLAHSHGGKNGTAYQTVSELNRNKNNMEGLIELLHYDDPAESLDPSTKAPNTFSHIGFVVPDPVKVERRLNDYGAEIIKGIGGLPTDENLEIIANSYGLGNLFRTNREEAIAILTLLTKSVPGANETIYVLDPDGNFIEVQPQE